MMFPQIWCASLLQVPVETNISETKDLVGELARRYAQLIFNLFVLKRWLYIYREEDCYFISKSDEEVPWGDYIQLHLLFCSQCVRFWGSIEREDELHEWTYGCIMWFCLIWAGWMPANRWTDRMDDRANLTLLWVRLFSLSIQRDVQRSTTSTDQWRWDAYPQSRASLGSRSPLPSWRGGGNLCDNTKEERILLWGSHQVFPVTP